MLPFLCADVKMAPAGVRAIGSAMLDAGFPKTRIVLQQWNPNFRPSRMRIDGRIPDLFMVSSMSMHAAPCEALIRDACRIDPRHRPLIIAGGPKVIYEPWSVFSDDPHDTAAADVAVTGEEYVLLSLLEVLLSVRAEGESMRSAFLRARDSGALDGIPGLVYARTDARGVAEELVDTGIQRLLGDLDELPHPVLGYRLLEPPSRGETLAPEAMPADRVRKHSRVASLVLTQGCRFRCRIARSPPTTSASLAARAASDWPTRSAASTASTTSASSSAPTTTSSATGNGPWRSGKHWPARSMPAPGPTARSAGPRRPRSTTC